MKTSILVVYVSLRSRPSFSYHNIFTGDCIYIKVFRSWFFFQQLLKNMLLCQTSTSTVNKSVGGIYVWVFIHIQIVFVINSVSWLKVICVMLFLDVRNCTLQSWIYIWSLNLCNYSHPANFIQVNIDALNDSTVHQNRHLSQ